MFMISTPTSVPKRPSVESAKANCKKESDDTINVFEPLPSTVPLTRPEIVKIRNSQGRSLAANQTGNRITITTIGSAKQTPTPPIPIYAPHPLLQYCRPLNRRSQNAQDVAACETLKTDDNRMPPRLANYSSNFPNTHEFSADCKEVIVNVYEYLKARCVAEPEKETARACEIRLEQLQQILLAIPKDFEAKNGARRFSEPESEASRRRRNRHMWPMAFECSQCDFVTKRDYTLRLHINKTHKGIIGTFLCEICGKTCKTREGLKAHVNRHNQVKPFKCEVCSQRFVDKNCWRIHQNQHFGARPFACKYCGKTFTQCGSRKRHEVVSHTQGYKFKCKMCKKRFIYQYELKKHSLKCISNDSNLQ